MATIETKPAIKSWTIWGTLIAALPQVWDVVLTNLPAISEQIDVVIAAGVLSPHVTTTLTIVGAGIALFGRLTGSKKISGVFSVNK